MTLMEHLRELRTRLFRACLGIVAGLCVGVYFAKPIQDFLNRPYCQLRPGEACAFVATSPVSPFLLNLRIGLYAGLMLSAPIWLYQLWAFIAPGLHRRERRYSYAFAAVAAPLFFAGAILAYLVVAKTLHVFLSASSDYAITIDISGYFDFVTNMMLLFGAGFEFPLIVVALNFVGLVSARRLLGWWRIAVFLMFAFGAVVTPTPDPFGMSILAGSMALLYFGAVGVAFLNDRRKARRHTAEFGELDDDEVSPLDNEPEPVQAGPAVDAVASSEAVAAPLPLDRRYDDTT